MRLFKKSMAVFFAVAMCLTSFLGLGATTAYAAEEVTDEVVMFSFPRSGDQNYNEYGRSVRSAPVKVICSTIPCTIPTPMPDITP